MWSKGVAALVAAAVTSPTAAQAEWITRKGGALGTLVSNTTAAGDELFFFCSRRGLAIGFVWRVSAKPGGPSDLTQTPIAVSLDDGPATPATFAGFDGAWVADDANSLALAPALPKGAVVTVVIADSHAAAFETPRQEYQMTGFNAAFAKARYPARCQLK